MNGVRSVTVSRAGRSPSGEVRSAAASRPSAGTTTSTWPAAVVPATVSSTAPTPSACRAAETHAATVRARSAGDGWGMSVVPYPARGAVIDHLMAGVG